MAVTKEQKKTFNEKVKAYKNYLDELKKEESTLKAVGRKNSKIDPYVQMRLTGLGIQRVSTLLLMSRLSMKIQGLKNESYLTDSRKEISNRINILLKIVGDDLEGSLTENKDRLRLLKHMTPSQRYKLVQGLKSITEELKEILGPNSKWRWSFPELHYKVGLLAKNLFDFQEYGKSKDPNEEFFHVRQEMLNFITFELLYSAQDYRSRYELSTQDVGDLQIVQKIFEGVIKIYSITGNSAEASRVKTSLDAVTELIGSKSGGKKKK